LGFEHGEVESQFFLGSLHTRCPDEQRGDLGVGGQVAGRPIDVEGAERLEEARGDLLRRRVR
jgi:hypothetical protein